MDERDETEFARVLDAARAGDSRAFERLYTQLNRRVHGFARMRGASDPEGLVNEVFLSVFTNLGTFEGSAAQFNSWVFTIARNKLIDESRRRHRRVLETMPPDGFDAESFAGAANDDVESETLTMLTNERLVSQLQALTDEQRDAVLLRVVSDLSIDMIAGIMNKRPGAVKALLRRAFRTIVRTGLWRAVPL